MPISQTYCHGKLLEFLLQNRAWEVKRSPLDLRYAIERSWLSLPDGELLGPVAGVATDSKNRVFVFHRGKETAPVLCFSHNGTLLFSWSHLSFNQPHMVHCDKDDNVWLVDDSDHVIYKLSPTGQILLVLGNKGEPGVDKTHFNRPTDIAFNSRGEMYVSDGYENKRIVKFDTDGNYIGQWGCLGDGPGEFLLPHAIVIDANDLVYVADRANWQIQVFDPIGNPIDQWSHIGRPSDLVPKNDGGFFICDGPTGRVTQVKDSGKISGFFGQPGHNPGQLASAHSITCLQDHSIITGHLDGRVQLFAPQQTT